MSQRPSLRTMTRVLLLLIFRLSERYICRKLTTALFWSLSVTLGDSTATSIFLGSEMRCLRTASHSERASPLGVLKSWAYKAREVSPFCLAPAAAQAYTSCSDSPLPPSLRRC